MEKIASFSVDHNKLEPGFYISRIDGDVITYDMRTRKPNMGNYMDNLTMHSVEHMFATYIRNSVISKNVIYFGPMGCQTGFYLLVRNEEKESVLHVVRQILKQIIDHTGDIFGNRMEECGNYRNLNLDAAKLECQRYLNILNSKEISFRYE